MRKIRSKNKNIVLKMSYGKLLNLTKITANDSKKCQNALMK